MPPSNKLAIANIALGKIGSRAINSFDQIGSNEAVIIKNVYDDILEEVLSEFPWSFAQKRVALTPVVPDDVSRTINGRIYTPVAITGATADEPVVITAADHGLSNLDRIKIVGVVGMTQLNNNFYRVRVITVDTFQLLNEDDESDIDGDAYTAYSSGGKIYLAQFSDPQIITAVTAANPPVVTSAAHGLVNGAWIKVIGVSGMTQLNGNFYIVANVTTNTFTLQDTDEEDIDASAYTAYVSGGQILEAPELPNVDTGKAVVVYEKPSDMIKPIKKSDRLADINVEQDKIISNVEDLMIIYTFLNEDTTVYFPKFVQAFATRLAAEICFPITESATKSAELLKHYYDNVLPMATSVDSTQNTPDEAIADEWERARMQSGYGVFATTGQTWHPC